MRSTNELILYQSDELVENSTVRKFRTVRIEGNREVSRELLHYTLDVILFSHAHDRFLILDEKELYHFGASLKDLGKKWFAFSRMDTMTKVVLNQLNKPKP